MKKISNLLERSILYLSVNKNLFKRNLQMPGDGRYQPDALKPYLGYDQWICWLIIVEWFWLETLAMLGEMPKSDAKYLKQEYLLKMLAKLTTTDQDQIEKETKHDILALIKLMKKFLPKPLHKWLHFCATSYDIIDTAYALQIRATFENIFWPKLKNVDQLWRNQIDKNLTVIQAGRTHLQTALPVTVSFWLAVLHNRFNDTANKAYKASKVVPGQFSGAVGTKASQVALLNTLIGEKTLMDMLKLKPTEISTQITPPEDKARYYLELVLLSGTMGNLGDDARLLQATQFGELVSASSSSSAMSHKTSNPIAAENDAGMHVTVIAEYQKVLLTLISNLQRDLRWSNVLRSFSAVMVYTYQQLLTTERLLKSIKVNKEKCRQNFEVHAKLVMGELLHLSLQREGIPDAHHFINKTIVPGAVKSGNDLDSEMFLYTMKGGNKKLKSAYQNIPDEVRALLKKPEAYIGIAQNLAYKEIKNRLK